MQETEFLRRNDILNYSDYIIPLVITYVVVLSVIFILIYKGFGIESISRWINRSKVIIQEEEGKVTLLYRKGELISWKQSQWEDNPYIVFEILLGVCRVLLGLEGTKYLKKTIEDDMFEDEVSNLLHHVFSFNRARVVIFCNARKDEYGLAISSWEGYPNNFRIEFRIEEWTEDPKFVYFLVQSLVYAILNKKKFKNYCRERIRKNMHERDVIREKMLRGEF
jgi:hypothetical protein